MAAKRSTTPKKSPITEQDRLQAVRLLGLFGQEVTEQRVRALAIELAFYRKTVIECAVVQTLRELAAARDAGGGSQ